MKVLIAVDGSEHAINAIKWYLNQHKEDTEVIIVHVIEFPITPAFSFKVGVTLPQYEWDAIVHRANDQADEVKKKVHLLLQHTSHNYIRRDGKPGQTICDVAKEEDVTFVVIGTRGMGKLRRTFLGSVSDYVLHHAHVPVAICQH